MVPLPLLLMAGNVPSEKVYKAASYFSAEKGKRAAEKQAAKFIQRTVVDAARDYLRRLDEACVASQDRAEAREKAAVD